MRMAANKLGAQLVDHHIKIKASLLACHLSMKDHLQEHIAKLFGHAMVVAQIHSFQKLVRLFQETPFDAFVGLLLVPRTTVRSPQTRHDLAQLLK